MIIHLHDQNQAVAKPADVNKILQAVLESESLEDRDKEHFWVFMLTARNTIKSLDLVSLGTLDMTVAHPREVFRRAITTGCYSIVIAHNHPSGDPTPSSKDLEMTEKLKQAGEILGIEVLDHVIITTGDDYTSLKESGHV